MDTSRKMGWKRDRRQAPRLYSVPGITTAFPDDFSTRPGFPFGPQDQQQLSACTGFGTTKVIAFMRKKEGHALWPLSEGFPYYNGRDREGNANADDGARIEDVVDSLLDFGYCSEKTWPTNPQTICERPSDAAYAEAKPNDNVRRTRVPQVESAIKHALMTVGPLVGGLICFEGPEGIMGSHAAQTGEVDVPAGNRGIIGGHCVALTGWRRDGRWEFGNSWGMWGDQGFGWLAKAYLLDPQMAGDLTLLTYA